MRAKAPLYPWSEYLSGLALALGAFFLAAELIAACGTPTLAACRMNAVAALPLEDPDSITVGEARALALRLKACTEPDAGR